MNNLRVECLENDLCLEIERSIDSYMMSIIKDEIDYILNNIVIENFLNETNLKLELLKYNLSVRCYFRRVAVNAIMENLSIYLFGSRMIDKVRFPNVKQNFFGKVFEKFVIESLYENKSIKVLSTQYKKTDAIVEFKGEKFIVEIKSGESMQCIFNQIERYKKDTGISRAVSVNGKYTFSTNPIDASMIDYIFTVRDMNLFEYINHDKLNNVLKSKGNMYDMFLVLKIINIKKKLISASDYHYTMAKERLFKKYVVWNWEEIPTYKYDDIHADIDSIEDLDSIYF